PPAAVALPFDDGTAISIQPSVELTVRSLGLDDAAVSATLRDVRQSWNLIDQEVIGTARNSRLPAGFRKVRVGRYAISNTAHSGAFSRFSGGCSVRRIVSGCMLPLEKSPAAAFGLVLETVAHAIGWPIPQNGSRSIAHALASIFTALGRIITGRYVQSLDDLPTMQLVHC